jgi:hypothetical protein
MPADVKETLVGLRDIRGIEGSFLLLLPEGHVVSRESMPMVSDDSLAETGRRLSNVFGALGSACPAADELLLRFDGMSLFARRGAHVLLGVLATDTASLPALRMASNLVLRQVDSADLSNVLSTPSRPPQPAAPATKPATRYWRGTPVGDDT